MTLHHSTQVRRFRAIKRLQDNLRKSKPETYLSIIYEKALELALNKKRAVDANFYYRVIDDAKRSLRRERKTHPSIVGLFTSLNEENQEEIENPILADYVTPEQEIIYKQSLSLMRSACSKKHRCSVSVFYSMVNGYTVEETAKCLGISESMVKKLRSEIIRIAKSILLN